MIEFAVGKFLTDALFLKGLAAGVRDAPGRVTKNAGAIYLDGAKDLHAHIQRLDLGASKRAASRLIGNLQDMEDRYLYSDFVRQVEDLLLRLRDELDVTNFLVIESSKIPFYESNQPRFGQNVLSGYPSAYFEIEEAGKCLALGRGTACVFHLMRAMEVGIKAVAASLKVPDPVRPSQRNWGFILKTIKDAIDAKTKWSRRANRHFYEGVYASLDSVKNPWRNATMHVEQTYTDEEAENIYYAVRAFMSKIASCFDENGKPLSTRTSA